MPKGLWTHSPDTPSCPQPCSSAPILLRLHQLCHPGPWAGSQLCHLQESRAPPRYPSGPPSWHLGRELGVPGSRGDFVFLPQCQVTVTPPGVTASVPDGESSPGTLRVSSGGDRAPAQHARPQPGSRDVQSCLAQLLFCFHKSAGPSRRGVRGAGRPRSGARGRECAGGAARGKPAVVKTCSLRKAPWQGCAAGPGLCPAWPALPKLCQTHGRCSWHPALTLQGGPQIVCW